MKLRLHSQSGRKQYHYYQTSGAKDILGLAQTTTATIFFSGKGFNCFSVSAQWDIPRHPQPFPTVFLFPFPCQTTSNNASYCLVNVKNWWASFRLDEHLIKGL